MISKSKIALIAAIAAVGIATPALAAGAQHQTAARGHTLYDSATTPNSNSNWANDAAWSTAGRQSSGR